MKNTYKVTIICDVKLSDTKRIIKNQVKFKSDLINTKSDAKELLKRKVEKLKKNALELYHEIDKYTNIKGIITEYQETNKIEMEF